MSQKDKTILHIKSQRGNSYLYDSSTNLVYPDINGFSEIVSDYHTLNKEEIIEKLSSKYDKYSLVENYNYIDKLVKKHNAFYSNSSKVDNFVPKNEETLNDYLSNACQIVLELTQSCNLRCGYCIYSGEYEDFRQHDTKYMTFEIATKSIDMFLSYIKSERRTRKFGRVFINFYGGEPLLNFDLIKRVVDYVRNKIKVESILKDKIYFTMSTNGTLLKDEILDYLIDNKFLLAISMDGPKEEHDKNRVTQSGEGSFDLIWNNLGRLMERNYDYFQSNVVFLLTITPNHDLKRLNDFFKNNSSDKYGRIKVSFVRSGEKNNFGYHSRQEVAKLKEDYFKKNDEKNVFLEALFSPFYDKILRKQFPGRNSQYTSACMPDQYRLFVSSTGNFHLCERINSHFQIGDYENGIQYDKIKDIYESYNKQVISERCHTCAAKNFCSICFATAASGEKFTVDELCTEQVKVLKGMLTDVISIAENDPEAFHNFKPKTNEEALLTEAFY